MACIPAVVNGHDIAVILNVACCWPYCCCLCHCYCLHPGCDRHSCCCWHPLSSCWFPVSYLSDIADIPCVTNGVVGAFAAPFKHAVAGSPAVTGFPAVYDVLAVASAPADPDVPILACCFTYWIVEETYYSIGPPDYGNFFLLSNYLNIKYCIGEFKKLSDYGIPDQGLNLSDYWILDSEKTIVCPPLAIVLCSRIGAHAVLLMKFAAAKHCPIQYNIAPCCW